MDFSNMTTQELEQWLVHTSLNAIRETLQAYPTSAVREVFRKLYDMPLVPRKSKDVIIADIVDYASSLVRTIDLCKNL